MSEFMLDYTPPPARPRPKRISGRPLARGLWRAASPLLVAGLLAGLVHSRSEYQALHRRHQTQLLRYDSLLAARQEAANGAFRKVFQQAAGQDTVLRKGGGPSPAEAGWRQAPPRVLFRPASGPP